MGRDGQADQHGCLRTHIIYVCWFCLFDHSGQPAGVCLGRDVRFEMSSNYDLLVALRNETGLRKSCCWDLHSTLVSCLQGLQVVTSWSFLKRAAWTKPKDDIYINLICCVPLWLCSFSLMKQTEILDLEQCHISYPVPHDTLCSSPEGSYHWDKPLTSFLCLLPLFGIFSGVSLFRIHEFCAAPFTVVSLREGGRMENSPSQLSQ